MEVHKFGGSVIKNAEQIRLIRTIISKLRRPAVLVVSALFDVTNMLERIYRFLQEERYEKATSEINKVIEKHITIAEHLNIETNRIYEILYPLTIQEKDLSYAEVVSLGEKLSSYLIYEFLRREGFENIKYVPAQSFMITSSHQFGAIPKLEKISKLFTPPDENELILTEGFIGADEKGNPTTLGREGSDFTATIIASILNSKRVTLWKNVSGIYNADPAEFKGARIFENINVNEAIEMTFFGARVLHPRTFTPLENKNAKLIIKSPFSEKYTTVSEEPTQPFQPIFILHKNVRLISCYLKYPDLMDAVDYARIYQLSAEHKVPIKLLQKGARSLSLVVPENIPTLDEFMLHLSENYNVRFNDNLFLLTIRHLRQNITELLKGEIILSEITRQTQHYLMTEWQPIDISALS
ncbi:MAG: aspartate kinase [Chlorobi bacterium]|nr:aspartate kinase [Chlorobiota bacterium]